MGGNKLFLSLQDMPVLEKVLGRLEPYFEEVLLAVGPEDRLPLERILAGRDARSKVRIVEDRASGKGPLEGLARGLQALRTEWGFFVGCDMPWIQEAVVRTLWEVRKEESQALVVRLGTYLEPLHAFYSRSCLSEIERSLRENRLQLKSFYASVCLTVAEESLFASLPGYRRSFRGVNVPRDLWRLAYPHVCDSPFPNTEDLRFFSGSTGEKDP